MVSSAKLWSVVHVGALSGTVRRQNQHRPQQNQQLVDDSAYTYQLSGVA